MQFAFSRALFICALCALAAAKQPQQQQQQQSQPQPQQQQKQAQSAKLKRDAGLSFGSGLYHGPSHKYLPPAASSGGYESTYAQLHGNGLAASSGFDFASLDTDSVHHGPVHHQSQHHHPYHSHHQHHYSHQPHTYQSLGSYHGHGRPVYISSSSLAAGAGPSYHHQRPPKVETYIVHTSNGGGGGGSSASHGFSQHGHGSAGYKYSGHGGASGYLSLLSGGGSHKQPGSSTTYLLTTPSYSSSSGSLGSNSLGSLSSLGSLGSSGSSHGISFGHGHPLSLGSSSSSSHSHGLSFGPALEHEQQQPLGYSYESPSLQHFAKQPLNSYGVPLLPGYDHGQQEEEQHQHQQQLHQDEQQLPVEKSHTEQQTPAYALGHKGLGHFSYTSSKPLALNTDIHQHEDQNELVAELSKAPFKPSAFLGAKHESSLGYSDYATPNTQYLQPPTATGYDYAAPGPAVLYGAPGQSGDSATPIFEPDSTYLPPTHNYH